MPFMAGNYEIPKHRQDAMIVPGVPGEERILMHRLRQQLSPEEIAELQRRENRSKLLDAMQLARKLPLWSPTPVQEIAFNSPAKVILAGGAVGGGKSGLGIGMILTRAKRALIIRQNAADVDKGIIKDLERFTNNTARRNKGDKTWEFVGTDLVIDWTGLSTEQDLNSIYGVPYDLMFIDEANQINGDWIHLIQTWNRSVELKQPCVVLMTCNPPDSREGMFLHDDFEPWIGQDYKGKRAESGEIRYFLPREGEEGGGSVECGPDETRTIMIDGNPEVVGPTTRTFVAMFLNNNPYLNKDTYLKGLLQLGQREVDRLVKGKWDVKFKDQNLQVIPVDWIRDAQKRWTPGGYNDPDMHSPFDIQQSTLGVDPSGEGQDKTVICERWGTWFSEPYESDKASSETGEKIASRTMQYRKNPFAPVYIDGGGIGQDALGRLVDNIGSMACPVLSQASPWAVQVMKVGKTDTGKDKIKKIEFLNVRAMLWWRMRELLNPMNGHCIALPPHNRLLMELSTPTWQWSGDKIQVESKKLIKKRLKGQSTDYADAFIHAAIGLSVRHMDQVRKDVAENRFDNKKKKTEDRGPLDHFKKGQDIFGAGRGNYGPHDWMGR